MLSIKGVFSKLVLAVTFCVLPISAQASVNIEVKFKDSASRSAYFDSLSSAKLKRNTATSSTNDFKLIPVYTSAKASKLLLKKNISSNTLDKKLAERGLDNVYRINCDDACDPDKLLKDLSSLGLFEYVEKDEPLDIHFDAVDPLLESNGSIWNKAYKESWHLDTIKAKEAWAKTTGANTIVAVIDTGILVNHPELTKQIWVDRTKVSDLNGDGLVNVLDMDNNRDGVITISGQPGVITGELITGSIGRDFLDEEYPISIVYSEDPIGHGTFIAGIIAAEKDNGKGLAGIVPSSKILNLASSRKPFGIKATQMADYIKYAVDTGADVINISSAWPDDFFSIKNSLAYAVANDVIVVCAAGNDGFDASLAPLRYPHTYDNVISVGSVNFNNTLSFFSNYGTTVDVLAPGENIVSTTSVDQEDYSVFEQVGSLDDSKHGYRISDGTSFSSPMVASAVAMLKSLKPDINFESVLKVLKNTSNTSFNASGKTFSAGVGVLDLSKMVNEYQNYLATPTPTPGKLEISRDTVMEIYGDLVGFLSVTGGSYSRYSYDYTLVGGDLDSFQIKLSDALYASKKLDYEAKPLYKVMVRATSPDGKFFDSEIIVKVEDVSGIVDPNDSSIYLTLSRDSIQENLAIGTEIGTLQSNVINSQYSYSMIEGGENFGIQSGTYSFSSPVLVSKKSFDYEAQKDYKVKLRLSYKEDPTMFVDRELIVKILNQVSESNGTNPDTDTNSSFKYNSSNSLSLGSPVGTVLGTFTADSGKSLSTYLMGSAKSKAKKLFSIVDNKLVLKKTLGRKMRGQAVYLRVGGTVDGNIADDVYLTVRVN
jgi:subtilisin family serine protease